MRLVVTGFGPFGDVKENPSRELALRISADPPSGWETDVRSLEVTYRDALEALEEMKAIAPGVLFELGLHGADDRMRLELFGWRNVSDKPDNEGVVGSMEMLPRGPEAIPSSLFTGGLAEWIDHPRLVESESAGAYLCNFWYYATLAGLPDVRCGFVHVPHSEGSRPDGPHMTLAEQEELLRSTLTELRKGL